MTKKLQKIFHYGRADLAHIKHYLIIANQQCIRYKNCILLLQERGVIDHSLKTLIKEFFNVDISKQFQNSDIGAN